MGLTMSHDSIHVSYEDRGGTGRYLVRIDGVEGEGELVVSKASAALVTATRTFVPETMRGTGAALALVERLIADARATGRFVVPLCPYVKAQSLKHPEWADIIRD